jgi:hypothetical protein
MATDPPKDMRGQDMAALGTVSAAVPLLSVKYLSDKLAQAELLLSYVAEVGIKVEDKVRDSVLQATLARDDGKIGEQTAADLLTALTTLAAQVRPVTVESLMACARPKEARDTISFYGKMAMGIGFIILCISLCTFVSRQVAEKINADVEIANDLASKLRTELGPSPLTNQSPTKATVGTNVAANLSQDEVWWGTNEPPRTLSDKEVISDLQQFAATMRQINGYAKQLKYFLLNFEPVPYAAKLTNGVTGQRALELTPGLYVRFSDELTQRTEEYQMVRNFANSVQEKVTVYYGAIATCILPVLYALLGAGAYLLRLYESQIRNRTFVGGDRHVARFLTAGIGGLVVGQFNVTQGVTISPFAVAFLVGYAVDVFFAFLEGLLQMFKRSPGNMSAQGTPPTLEN